MCTLNPLQLLVVFDIIFQLVLSHWRERSSCSLSNALSMDFYIHVCRSPCFKCQSKLTKKFMDSCYEWWRTLFCNLEEVPDSDWNTSNCNILLTPNLSWRQLINSGSGCDHFGVDVRRTWVWWKCRRMVMMRGWWRLWNFLKLSRNDQWGFASDQLPGTAYIL